MTAMLLLMMMTMMITSIMSLTVNILVRKMTTDPATGETKWRRRSRLACGGAGDSFLK